MTSGLAPCHRHDGAQLVSRLSMLSENARPPSRWPVRSMRWGTDISMGFSSLPSLGDCAEQILSLCRTNVSISENLGAEAIGPNSRPYSWNQFQFPRETRFRGRRSVSQQRR